MNADRLNALEQLGKPVQIALACEFDRAVAVIPDAIGGATNFAKGAGRHGSFASFSENSKPPNPTPSKL